MSDSTATLIPYRDAKTGIALVMAAAALWATVGVAVQMTPEAAVLPDTVLAAARTGIAGVTLLAVWFLGARGRMADLRHLGLKPLAIFALSSALFQVSLFRCFAELGVTVAVFLTVCLPPVLGSVWAAIRGAGAPSAAVATSLGLALAGVALVSLAGQGQGHAILNLPGLMNGIIASVAFVAMSLSAAQLSRKAPAVLVAGAGLSLSSVLLGALVILSKVDLAPIGGFAATSSVTLGLLLYLGLLPTAMAYLCYCAGMARCRTPVVGLVASMVEPFLAALLAFALIGERVTPATMAGCALLVAAMMLLWRAEKTWAAGTSRSATSLQPKLPPCCPASASAPLVEDEERPGGDEAKSDKVVPGQWFLQVENREDGEDRKRDDLLDGLQFRRREVAMADPVRGHHQAVFEERDPPADKDYSHQRGLLELQVPVPGKGHEDVGGQEEADGDDRDGQGRHGILGFRACSG
jgi:DME family drug/metabolite transporter